MQFKVLALPLALAATTLVSAAPISQGHIVAREPLNAAGMIGLTIGSVFKGMFGSKEAADEFLSTEEGQAFVSKLASDLEAEDETDLAKREPLFFGAAVKGLMDVFKKNPSVLGHKVRDLAEDAFDKRDPFFWTPILAGLGYTKSNPGLLGNVAATNKGAALDKREPLNPFATAFSIGLPLFTSFMSKNKEALQDENFDVNQFLKEASIQARSANLDASADLDLLGLLQSSLDVDARV